MLHGIDISGWQEGIQLANVPADFVIIKGTGGAGYVSAECELLKRKHSGLLITAVPILTVRLFPC